MRVARARSLFPMAVTACLCGFMLFGVAQRPVWGSFLSSDVQEAEASSDEGSGRKGWTDAFSAQDLQFLNGVVGEWRTVAQPKRGYSRNAWMTELDGVWDFSGDESTLSVSSDQARLLRYVRVSGGTSKDPDLLVSVEWNVTLRDSLPQTTASARQIKADAKWQVHRFKLKRDESGPAGSDNLNQIVFESATPEDDGRSYRLTMRRLSEIRMTMLLERSPASSPRWERLVEFGATRKGQRLASSDGSGPICIVTGGQGSMTVEHEGKIWYVCCSGCRQAFEADPEGTIAAWKARNDNPETGP